MSYFFCFVGTIIILLAFMIFLKLSRTLPNQPKKAALTKKNDSKSASFVRCPLCNTHLARGEQLYSRIYRPMTTPDQRITVHGCPHCYPVPEAGVKRICPVCGKPVPTDKELTARLFNRTGKKKHVVIVGCGNCAGK